MPKSMKLGDDFTEDEEEDEESEEEKEEKKEGEEQTPDEDNEDKSSADTSDGEEDEDSQQDKIDDIKEDDTKTEEEKLKELEGLKNTEDKLDNDLSEIDLEIKKARQRIVGKRGDRRSKRELVDNIDGKYPESKEDDLSDIDSDTLQVLDRFVKAKGLVPKAELQQMQYETAHKTAEDTFFETHKEYDSENDKDDFLYNALKKELSFFAPPKDSKLIPKLFEKAHKAVVDQNPEFFKKGSSAKEIEEKKKRIKRAGTGGGTAGGTSSSDKSKGGKKALNDVQIAALRAGGWDEDEIKSF